MATQSPHQEVSAQTPVSTIVKKQDVSKLITSKEQILAHCPDVFDGIGKFPGSSIQYSAKSKHCT